jgi:hypothetical protein
MLRPSGGLLSHILTKADASFLKKYAGNGTGDSLMVFSKIWSAEACFFFWNQKVLLNSLPENSALLTLLQSERNHPG